MLLLLVSRASRCNIISATRLFSKSLFALPTRWYILQQKPGGSSGQAVKAQQQDEGEAVEAEGEEAAVVLEGKAVQLEEDGQSKKSFGTMSRGGKAEH